MKKINIGNGKIEAPEIGLGCMRITGLDNEKEIRALIDTAMEEGINFLTMRIFMRAVRPKPRSAKP